MKPLWLFFAELLPLLLVLSLLARFRHVYPHRPLVYLALLPGLLSLVLLAAPGWRTPLLVVDVVVVLAAAIDLATLARPRDFSCDREIGRIASLQKDHPVTLTINNLSKREQVLWIRDDVPSDLHPEPEEFLLRLAGRSRAALKYHLRSVRRGAFYLHRVHCRTRSRWGLWQRLFDCPLESEVYVYPRAIER